MTREELEKLRTADAWQCDGGKLQVGTRDEDGDFEPAHEGELFAVLAALSSAPPDLAALVQEWQEARKPYALAAPGVGVAETYQRAVQRMNAADEALAAYQLNGPAGGALVGQTAPTESTGHYLCACTCGCVDLTISPGRCMVCRVRESCLKDERICEACEAGYRLASDGVHYRDDSDSTWGVCRKVVASIKLGAGLRSWP